MTQHAVFQEDDLYFSDAPVGEILRNARMHYGQRLQDVEVALRIRASQLDAIERSDFDRLPGRVYAVGFIRTYADYLGLNPERMVKLFKSQSMYKAPDNVVQFPVEALETHLPKKALLVVCAIGFIALLASASYLFKPQPIAIETVGDYSVFQDHYDQDTASFHTENRSNFFSNAIDQPLLVE